MEPAADMEFGGVGMKTNDLGFVHPILNLELLFDS